ncbi:hypothetical protein [Solicola gregarius]|uniref:Uncharacterized protein n=1 Tax=Solicola gregarius TaxID=2908642 RepID=A0AA46TF68_9ACTN|nr:hypothetical protein [Solicola gregarius]UYM04068.1 hypothetical protein L0C25_16155 [Solicola gregarius]
MDDRDQTTDRQELDRLRRRVEELAGHRRQAETFGGFSRIYAALGVALLVVSFLPMYDRAVDKDSGLSWSYGSIWEILGQDNSGASTLGVLLLIGLVGLLAIAGFVRIDESVGLLGSIAAIGLLLALMVVTKPATPDVKPDVAYGGQAGVALVLTAAAVAAAHAWVILRERTRASRQSASSPRR